ncbi:MAG: PilZ domain-containing protein [Planctomycetes bacterium]|nr:PilZ domain-containing protein [Planctomycetota bacterium]
MPEQPTSTGLDNRRGDRLPLEGAVTVELDAGVIAGSGQNISPQGVFFTATGALPVRVRIAGHEHGVRGELVRYESMGDGRVGIAIRFLEPLPSAAG